MLCGGLEKEYKGGENELCRGLEKVYIYRGGENVLCGGLEKGYSYGGWGRKRN